MAATPITVNTIVHALTADVARTTGDPANGHSVVNGPRVWLLIDNLDPSNPHTVTFNFATKPDGQAVTPKPITVPANTKDNTYLLGDAAIYGNVTTFTVDSAQLKISAWTV